MSMNPRLLRPLATGFNPLTLPGLEAWWDFADASSITLDSGRVSAVADKSGNGRTAANSTSGSTQPDYETGARNGRNVARFAAASTQRLTVASSTATFKFLHDGTPSYIALVKATGFVVDPNGIFALFGTLSSSSANIGLNVLIDDRTPFFNMRLALQIGRGVLGETAASTSNDNAMTAQQTHLLEFVLDAGNATANQRVKQTVDGSLLALSNANTFAPSSSAATNNFQIGCSGNNAQPFDGDICEMLVFSQHPSLAQQLALRRYLTTKWGVTFA